MFAFICRVAASSASVRSSGITFYLWQDLAELRKKSEEQRLKMIADAKKKMEDEAQIISSLVEWISGL